MKLEKVKEGFWFALLWLLCRSVIFTLSVDKKFHKIDKKDDLKNLKETDIRRSLFCIGWGAKKIYLFTYKDKFEIFHILKLEGKVLEEEELEEKCKRYTNLYLNQYRKDDFSFDIEFLKYKKDEEERRISVAREKMNIYNAIAVLFLTIIITAIVSLRNSIETNSLTIIVIIIFFYILGNIIWWIIDFLKVKGVIKSSFSTLKESTKKKLTSAQSYYKDWQSTKYYADIAVSYPLNIEYYIKIMYRLILIFLVFLTISFVLKPKEDSWKSNYVDKYYMESNQLSEIQDLQNILKDEKQDKIILINFDYENQMHMKIKNALELFNIKADEIIILDEKQMYLYNKAINIANDLNIIVIEEEVN